MTTRKIIDIEQNGKKVWPKGHAKATFMSDGRNVEEAINQIDTGGGGITAETDPVFLASPAASITEEKKAEWDNKVDKENGKGLSTEDFTSALKTKLEGLNNYDDTELSEALSTLRGDFDKLVSGDTTTAIKTFNEVIAFLDGIQDSQDLSSIIASIEQQIAAKQDKITDLDAIRSGAEKGATALQSYTEQYKGTITGVTIEASNGLSGGGTVSADTGSTDGTIKIRGIAATNKGRLGMSVLYSGDLKDKTYQDGAAAAAAHTHSQYLTGVIINGTTKNPSSGVVDLGTVITSHQDISGKQDKLVSGTNIKTINGTSILGSGNIEISGGSGTNKFYTTDFTVSDLQQLVNGDLTEVSANCSALSQALQNNQIIVIPYGLTDDGYFGYSLPDVYYEDLLYMTITDSGSGIVYTVEVDTYSNYISSGHVSIVNNNNGAIVQGGSAIDLKIDFDTLYGHYDRNRELDTIELAYTGCVDTLFRELTWDEVESLIRAGTYSFFTTNNFRDEYADRISCPVVVGYDAQGGIKSLHIYSQAADMPYHNYNYVITFMTGDGCTITRYRTGGYRQTNMGTSNVSHTLLPNEFYVWDEVTELNITLELAWADSTLYTYTKEYLFQFTSGSEPTTLSLPDSIKWANGEAPVIEANKIYQISILNGLGTVMSWDNSNLISFSVLWGASSVLNFECEKGMTWEAFVASSYNTDSALKISNGNIWYSSYRIEDATPTSIIENGKMYTSIYDD